MRIRLAAAGFPLVLVTCLFLVISNALGWSPQTQGNGQVLNGWMTGGGSFSTGTQSQGDYFTPPGTRITTSLDLNCNVANGPNSLQIEVHRPNGDGGQFQLNQLLYSYCWNDASVSAGSPSAAFDSMYGQGIGIYNGSQGFCADWEFVDAGEPGTNDRVGKLRVWQPSTAGDCSEGTFVFSSEGGHTLVDGNYQAHK